MIFPVRGITPFTPTSIEYAKGKAKHLRKLVADANLSLAMAQQVTAKALGHADWHALDQCIKAAQSPSALSHMLPPAEQAERWRHQRDTLLSVPAIAPSTIPDVLKDWSLTGDTRVQVTAVNEDVTRAVEQAWPRDESRIRLEVKYSVMFVVQRLTEDPTIPDKGSLKQLTLASLLDHQLLSRRELFGAEPPQRLWPRLFGRSLRAEMIALTICSKRF